MSMSNLFCRSWWRTFALFFWKTGISFFDGCGVPCSFDLLCRFCETHLTPQKTPAYSEVFDPGSLSAYDLGLAPSSMESLIQVVGKTCFRWNEKQQTVTSVLTTITLVRCLWRFVTLPPYIMFDMHVVGVVYVKHNSWRTAWIPTQQMTRAFCYLWRACLGSLLLYFTGGASQLSNGLVHDCLQFLRHVCLSWRGRISVHLSPRRLCYNTSCTWCWLYTINIWLYLMTRPAAQQMTRVPHCLWMACSGCPLLKIPCLHSLWVTCWFLCSPSAVV